MLVPATYPVHLKVDEVFVPLLLRGSVQEQIDYTDLLGREGQHIMVLGEPGSGKSSLFKRLFRDMCRRAASSPRQSPVPVLFELRDLSKTLKPGQQVTDQDLFNALISSLKQSAIYRAPRAVEDLSHGAGFLILLDGLDEISSALAPTVLDALTRLPKFLAESAPRSTLLVSSRTQYFFSLKYRELEEIFEVFTIRPFSLGDIYRFLTQWPFESNLRANITRIFSRLRQLPSLTEMCTNPLALSMLVARDQQTGGAELPETRSRFYDALIDELVVNRRSRRENLPTGRQRLRDARREILGSVCLQHLLSRDETPNSLPVGRFIEVIEKAGYGGSDAALSLADLANDTGLFAWEREGETMRFLHLTLCEFLAAAEVIEMGGSGWDKLLPFLVGTVGVGITEPTTFWDVRLSEVVAFASGLAPRSLRERILNDLSTRTKRRVLLQAIIEAQAYDEDIAVAAMQSEYADILQSAPGDWDTAWFARLRTVVTVLRDAAIGRRVELTSRSPQLLESSQLLMELIYRYHAEDKLLSTLARQDADSAISIAERTGRRELMDAVASAADDFAVLQGILGRCEKGVIRWHAALVERALTDRNIANLLHSSLKDETSDQGNAYSDGLWSRSWITRNTVYGNLLDSVLADSSSWSDRLAPLLERLARIRPPRSETPYLIRTAIRTTAPLLLLVYVPAFMMYILFLNNASPDRQALGLAILILIFAGYITYRIISVLVRRIRRDREAGLTVKAGGIEFKITSRSGSGNLTSGQGRRPEGSAVQLQRNMVLREILNIRSYRFIGLTGSPGVDVSLAIRVLLAAALTGLPRAEIRTLRVARALRQRDGGLVSIDEGRKNA